MDRLYQIERDLTTPMSIIRRRIPAIRRRCALDLAGPAGTPDRRRRVEA